MSVETKKFLDSAGTTHLWEKIKLALADKADASDLATLQAQVNNLDIPTAYDDTALAGRVTTTEGQLTTLIGSDSSKSIRTIANEELAAQLIPANADAARDTLAEIAAWIQSHPGDAATMNAAITALQNKTELGTHNVVVYAQATGEYVDGVTYYTDANGSEIVDTTSFEVGVTDVSNYYIATSSVQQYATVKAYVEAMMATVSDSSHSHNNKAVLDGITSTLITNWNTAYTNTHTHSNKSVLDNITDNMVTAWNAALQATDVIALTNSEIDAAIAAANQSQQSGGEG